MPVLTTQLVMLDDFVGRRGWATSYAKKMVQPRLYCRGEITELPYSNSGEVVDEAYLKKIAAESTSSTDPSKP